MLHKIPTEKKKKRNDQASRGMAATLVEENHKKLGSIPTLLQSSCEHQSKSFNLLDQCCPISQNSSNKCKSHMCFWIFISNSHIKKKNQRNRWLILNIYSIYVDM